MSEVNTVADALIACACKSVSSMENIKYQRQVRAEEWDKSQFYFMFPTKHQNTGGSLQVVFLHVNFMKITEELMKTVNRPE